VQANPNTVPHHSLPLELGTLSLVREEIARRADQWRTAWCMNGPAGIETIDVRLERLRELESVIEWIDRTIESSSQVDADLDVRLTLTCAGRAALGSAR
jgi:hypothetical protein